MATKKIRFKALEIIKILENNKKALSAAEIIEKANKDSVLKAIPQALKLEKALENNIKSLPQIKIIHSNNSKAFIHVKNIEQKQGVKTEQEKSGKPKQTIQEEQNLEDEEPYKTVIEKLKNQIAPISAEEIIDFVGEGSDLAKEYTPEELEKLLKDNAKELDSIKIEEINNIKQYIYKDLFEKERKTLIGEREVDLPLINWLWEKQKIKAFPIEQPGGQGQKKGTNEWRYTDVIGITSIEQFADETIRMAETTGIQSFQELISYEIKLSLTRENARKAAFQCLANSQWANRRYLVVPIDSIDDFAKSEIQKISKRYPVGLIEIGFKKIKNIPEEINQYMFTEVIIENIIENKITMKTISGNEIFKNVKHSDEIPERIKKNLYEIYDFEKNENDDYCFKFNESKFNNLKTQQLDKKIIKEFFKVIKYNFNYLNSSRIVVPCPRTDIDVFELDDLKNQWDNLSNWLESLSKKILI